MLKWLWLTALVLVLDQVSKHTAEALLEAYRPVELLPALNMTLAYNTGAAFSFLAGSGGWQRWFFLGLGLAISAVLLVWLRRLGPGERLQAVALALILGGALGNMIDRALFGHVIDFIEFHHHALAGWPGFDGSGRWPVFNVADVAISLGAVLLVLEALAGPFGRSQHASEKQAG